MPRNRWASFSLEFSMLFATAPTRIDLAGGTLDLHPLFLFLERPLTVNASVDLRSRAEVRPLEGTRVRLVSEDLGVAHEAPHPQDLPPGRDLDLLARAVRFYVPEGGLELRTRNTAPRGSGLGASSSLLMAISRVLCRFGGRMDSDEDLIRHGAALEAQNLGIPTGLQDYYGAILGGIKGLHFGVRGTRVESLAPSEGFREELDRSLLLSFTGISHFSGTSNWNMLKGYVEGQGQTVERMHAIEATAHEMWEALRAEDLPGVGRALAREWENRRALAEGVTTPGIDRMVESARNAGALASKICGAGGGGCLLTLARPDRREAVRQALEESGAQILQARLDDRGLEVEEACCA